MGPTVRNTDMIPSETETYSIHALAQMQSVLLSPISLDSSGSPVGGPNNLKAKMPDCTMSPKRLPRQGPSLADQVDLPLAGI